MMTECVCFCRNPVLIFTFDYNYVLKLFKAKPLLSGNRCSKQKLDVALGINS